MIGILVGGLQQGKRKEVKKESDFLVIIMACILVSFRYNRRRKKESEVER